MKILTIVIPAYNAENYLNKCIDSIVQSSVVNELDIIIVNDGSKDSTKYIAEMYKHQYPESIRVINKENGGHGSGVNCGIRYASAKYFKVVDSDDWLSTEYLEDYIKFLKQTDSDVILNNYCFVEILSGDTKRCIYKDVDYLKEYKIKDILPFKISFTMPNITYKTHLIQSIPLVLQENTFYVDEEYCVIPFMYVQTICFHDAILYNYLVGQTNQSIAFKNQIRNLSHKERVIIRLAQLWEKTPMTYENRKITHDKILQIYLSYFPIALIYNSNKKQGILDAKKLMTRIKVSSKKLFWANYIKCYVYLLMGYMNISPKLYEKIQNVRRKTR